MDISNAGKTADVLRGLREANPDTVSVADLAKELGISQKRIKEAVENDEVEIIKEYLLWEDSRVLYLKKSNPKNAEFIDKVMFENMLAENLKTQQKGKAKPESFGRFCSLKMRLAWSMCSHTKKVASGIAKDDGYLCNLLTKEKEDADRLTNAEKIRIKVYRKEIWSQAGMDELKFALKKAKEYMDIYFKDGIEAVPDEEARKIFKEYENEQI